MNVTDRSTLDSILEVAKSEFLVHGYRAVGLREIVKKAGVTTGAFYGYFKNKEELFSALVEKEYNHLLEIYRTMIESFGSLPMEEQIRNLDVHAKALLTSLSEYIFQHRDAFKLILCSSEGTEYSNLIHELAKLDSDATRELLDLSEMKINSKLEHMLISGMFATFFELIIHDVSEEEAEEYIAQMLSFYVGGWQNILGMERKVK